MSSLRTTVAPFFWRNPLRYCRWAAHEKPAIFYSVVVGSFGPIILVTAPPIRKYYGWENPPDIPTTYPIPTGPRKKLDGYGDS